MTDISTLSVLFVEDKKATQDAIDGYMEEYAFTREYAINYDEFKEKFPKIRPNVVVVDYDLNGGSNYHQIFTDVLFFSKKNDVIVGLVGVTARDPFAAIKKDFKQAGYEHVLLNNGKPEFYKDLVSIFQKMLTRIQK